MECRSRKGAAMSGNNVTKNSGTNSKRSRGRPRKHASNAAKQQAWRDSKSGSKPPLPCNLTLPFEQRFSLDIVFAGFFRGKLVEVWNPAHGRGILETVRIYDRHGEPISPRGKLRCLFHSTSGRRHWENLGFAQVWTLAPHDGRPKNLH